MGNKGVGVQNVSGRDIEQTTISLPPLPEQRRIVAKIDSLSRNSTRARQHLDHVPRLVEKYKQAVAHQLIHSKEWKTVGFLEVCDAHQPKTISKSELTPDGAVPCLRS